MKAGKLSAWRVQVMWAIGAMAAVLLLSAATAEAPAAEPLKVGGLPVTCNLTLPVACHALQNATKAGQTIVGSPAEYLKFTGWPELKESLIAGRVKVAYFLAPLAMELADKGIPVKVVALGHRSGAVVMVKTDAAIKSMKDLKGKRIAIPSRFAVDYLFVRRLLRQNGMSAADVQFVEMNPPDMPAALYAGAVAAFATGEPFGAVAEMAGYARPLYMTRNEWPNYICCVLTVRQELIDEDRAQVQQLVNYVMSAGIWLQASQSNRNLGADVAAGPRYFNQKPEVLRFVMNNPPDRVTYGDLWVIRAEFEELMGLAREAGIISRRVPYEKYVDESFVRNFKRVVIKIDR
ncbi:MAG: ABC transporter substrate-binding protein [Armatimonadota bacterium]